MAATCNDIHYIIGDIHGQYDQLCSLLDAISSRHHWMFEDCTGTLVFLGDYIDRGANSKSVIQRVMTGIDGFKSIFLKGNHEELLMKCLETDDHSVWRTWMAVGGRPALKSFGFDPVLGVPGPERLSEAIGSHTLDWLKSLQLYYRGNDFICVHAGLSPGVSLENQSEKDMLWIRRKFLDRDYDFGFGVIHGHTPSDRPVVKRHRIGIDTGAGQDGTLTALVVDRAWPDLIEAPTFLSA